MLIWMRTQERDGQSTLGKELELRSSVLRKAVSERQGLLLRVPVVKGREPWGPLPCSPEPVSSPSVTLHLACFTAAQRLLFSPFPAALPYSGFP